MFEFWRSRTLHALSPPLAAQYALGAWWTSNLSSSKWITVNINKARGAFFSRGSGTFHGTLIPLSSRSIIECCVLPTLLYGADLSPSKERLERGSFNCPSLSHIRYRCPSYEPLKQVINYMWLIRELFLSFNFFRTSQCVYCMDYKWDLAM